MVPERDGVLRASKDSPMQPPSSAEGPAFSTPRFCVIEHQPVRPGAVVLAVVAAACALSAISFGLTHSRRRHLAEEGARASRSSGSAGTSADADDDKDDPSQVDTIYLGDAADAPTPARHTGRVSSVHATILVRLPRYGPQEGLIPDVPAGHLLYQWLAAFNQSSQAAMEQVLPNNASALSSSAQMELRRQTGGFYLLSAREIQPGLLVFRLRDQTADANEVLGTLAVREGSNPPEIGSFSLRGAAADRTK